MRQTFSRCGNTPTTYGGSVNRPNCPEHLWMMAQMAHWGDIPFPRNWVEVLERVCRVSAFSTAARELGLMDIKYGGTQINLFDGVNLALLNLVC